MESKITVSQVVDALDEMTGGRVIKNLEEFSSGNNPFVVMKSSNIPGKSIIEIPGLVFGDSEREVKKIAILMTLTESAIELAGATGVDLIIAHHPVADAANSGGVTLKSYLTLYDIALIELHEAFHGLHPGIPYLHGHHPEKVNIAYGGIPGNIVFVGNPLPEVKKMGDIISRLNNFLGIEMEMKMLNNEQIIRQCTEIIETSVVTGGKIILGDRDDVVTKVLHIFPHTGFTPAHMEEVVKENPEIDTVVASISRVYDGHPLIAKAQELNLKFVVGNSHAVEIYENGLPLGYGVKSFLPEIEFVVFRERMTSTPIADTGGEAIQEYAHFITQNYLAKDKMKSIASK